MKLTINKACDLNSISVLPPHSRRPNGIASGSDSSIYGRTSQLRSQQSQVISSQSQSQSQFSQGGIYSLSQNSMDNIIKNEQRLASQERENSAKRISCLAPPNAREETQMSCLRSPNHYKSRWGSAAAPPVTDRHKCQISDELEHKIGQVETRQNRHGMVLESIQGDIMQVKKQMQEFALDIGGIKQKLAGHDNSLQLVLKGEEDIKATLDESLKSLPNQLRKDVHQEIVSAISALQNQNEEQMLKLTTELSGAFTNSVKAITSFLQPSDDNEPVPRMVKLKEREFDPIQFQNMKPAVTNSLQPSDNNESAPSMLKPKKRDCHAIQSQPKEHAITSSLQRFDNKKSVPSMPKLKERDCHAIRSQNMEPAMNSAILPQRVYNTRSKRKPEIREETRQASKQSPASFVYTKSKRKPEKQAETQQSSKQKPDSSANTQRSKMNLPGEIPLIDLDEKWRENNEWDEELDNGFAYLLGEKETGVGSSFFDEDQEAEQILKKARRRNRKHSNVIVLN